MDRRRIAEARRVFHRRARAFRLRDGEVDAVARRLIRCRGGSLYPGAAFVCARAPARWSWRAIFMSGGAVMAGQQALCAVSSTAWRCISPSRQARRYFRSPNLRLRKLHRAGICHNDLAKEHNWCAAATAAPTSRTFSSGLLQDPRPLFHIAAYEDLRHLLKHKRS